MTRKIPNIPVAVGNDDGSIIGSAELRAEYDAFLELGRPRIDSIKRIFGNLVNDNNCDALRDEMHKFFMAYLERVANTASNQDGRRKQLEAIERASKELMDELSKQPADWVVDRCLWLLPIDDILFHLRTLHKTARENLPAPSNAIKLWCVTELADMYERCAGGKATFTNPPLGGDISGPFVQFVQAVSRETNIEISLGTIEAALKARRREIKRATANKG